MYNICKLVKIKDYKKDLIISDYNGYDIIQSNREAVEIE